MVNGGTVSNNKGINVPGVRLSMPYLSERDISDIMFGVQCDYDFIAASFVRTAADVMQVCHWMEHSLSGVLSYMAIFAGIYASIWVAMYSAYRARIKKINADLNK